MNSITPARQSASDISRFLFGQSRGGEMLEEFCASGLVDDADVQLSGVRRALIYEFPWGFVAEHSSRDRWKWNFFVQHVWRTGTVEWWDEFAAAHRLLVQPEVAARQRPAGCAAQGLVFERGQAAFAAATYNSLGCASPASAREWIGGRLLPHLWPRVLKTAIDRAHRARSRSRAE